MSNDIQIVDGKAYSTKNWKLVYSDGAFSSRGLDVYMTAKKNFICVPWSKWQGERPKAYRMKVEELMALRHEGRLLAGLKEVGYEIPISEDL